jgi:hypothetical protein
MMTRLQLHQSFVSLFLIIGLFLTQGLLHPVKAIGPGTGGSKIRVNDEQIGPYTLLVATAPLPVTVGAMSVWVRVTETKTGQLRRDALVTVEAIPRGGGPMLTAQGTHKNAGNKYDYVAHLGVKDPGQWDITVYVEDEPGQVDVVFSETVTRGSSIRLLIGLGIPFVGLMVGVGVYLWRRSAAK